MKFERKIIAFLYAAFVLAAVGACDSVAKKDDEPRSEPKTTYGKAVDSARKLNNISDDHNRALQESAGE